MIFCEQKNTRKEAEKTQQAKILSWLVSSSKVKAIVDGTSQVTVDDISGTSHSTLYDGFHNLKSVQLKKLEKFFQEDALKNFYQLIEEKEENDSFTCGACKLGLPEAKEVVLCDTCLLWYHLTEDCAKCTRAPEGAYTCDSGRDN